jgi:hypothetical protein
MKYLVTVFLISLASIVLAKDAPTAAPETDDKCVSVSTVDGYSVLSNRCAYTINVVWFSEGPCSTGCKDKLSAKYHKYVSLLKTPYEIASCRSPEEVDPQWKGAGQPSCKLLAN